MNIVITGAAGAFGRVLTPVLSERHTVSPTDIRMAPGPRMIVRADVLNPEDVISLCADVDAVIHLAQAVRQEDLSEAANEALILDTRLKGTYNVLRAAADAGVRRVVHLSDLCIFDGYGEDIIVSEDFLPLPDTSAYQQSVYLSEWIAREFARQYPGLVVTLRIGQLVHEDQLAPGTPLRYDWLDVRDAIEAVEKAITIEHVNGFGPWGLYNLSADMPGSRYALSKIASGPFGFRPVHNFEAWWKEGAA
jgi:nucleoside-diphosphate-sugar epimerase